MSMDSSIGLYKGTLITDASQKLRGQTGSNILGCLAARTQGEESNVTVTFQAKGEDTLMTLVHADLPDTEGGRGHDKGWNFFFDSFSRGFSAQ